MHPFLLSTSVVTVKDERSLFSLALHSVSEFHHSVYKHWVISALGVTVVLIVDTDNSFFWKHQINSLKLLNLTRRV